MSTVAGAKSNPPPSGYSVSRPAGKCAATGREIVPGDKFMAMVKETPVGLERHDFVVEAWDQVDKTDALAYWQTIMPQPDAVKKKPFVDDEILSGLFERLSETTEENKLHFRFVLGLILMRKRLLIYESTENRDGNEFWQMRFKGREDKMSMLNPKLTEKQVKSVSEQLGQIMNEEL